MNSDRDIDFELDGKKVDEKLSVAVDHFIEYVTIEILLEKRKITL